MSAEAPTNSVNRSLPAVISLTVVLLVWGLFQAVSWYIAGQFEYPLDDVYIHLAVAEQIVAGGYGVNAGEYSSAASSPLYPFLLMPFAGGTMHRFLPAIINLGALIASALLWARFVTRCFQVPGWQMWVVLILGPIGLNFAGVAWAGMEHALHVAATLAVLCGIQTYLQSGQLTWLLLSGVLLGPLLRFEGLAVSLAAALVIVLTSSGKGKRGMSRVAGIICLGIMPVSLFCVFLIQLGLSALPNSVQAKLANASSHDALTTSNLVEVILSKFDRFPAVVLFSVLLVTLVIFLWNFRSMPPKFRAILGAMLFAGAGHLALGQFGWLNRYEIYIMTFVVGLFILFVTEKYAARPALAFFLIVSPLLASGYYYSLTNQLLAFSPRAVAMQQKQMARFVDEFYQNPVAVNDLGYVSWQNSHYVLDLWGLASAQALSIRQSNPAAGWAVPLLADNSVEFAMLYKDWLHNAVGPDWVELGDLVMDGPLGVVGNANVTFYATTEEAAVRLNVMLSDYARTLPDGVEFRFSQQSKQP